MKASALNGDPSQRYWPPARRLSTWQYPTGPIWPRRTYPLTAHVSGPVLPGPEVDAIEQLPVPGSCEGSKHLKPGRVSSRYLFRFRFGVHFKESLSLSVVTAV